MDTRSWECYTAIFLCLFSNVLYCYSQVVYYFKLWLEASYIVFKKIPMECKWKKKENVKMLVELPSMILITPFLPSFIVIYGVLSLCQTLCQKMEWKALLGFHGASNMRETVRLFPSSFALWLLLAVSGLFITSRKIRTDFPENHNILFLLPSNPIN